MLKIGIVGYGNLGKAVEELLINDDDFLVVGIFSRRNVSSNFSTPCYPMEKLNENLKIDLLVLCGGSDRDLIVQTPLLLEKYNIINTFDTHSKISQQTSKLKKIAIKHNKVGIICAGWDPGLFSIMRVLVKSLGAEPLTYWGKGVSLGHTNALKQIEGVNDGICYTIPNRKTASHSRLAVVVSDKSPKLLRASILKNKKYFSDFPIKIKVVPQDIFNEKYKSSNHAGSVEANFAMSEAMNSIEFKVKMDNNAKFTASIVKAYIKSIKKIKKVFGAGVYNLTEIPVSFLLENYKEYI